MRNVVPHGGEIMVSLDDEKWRELRHAYGSAEDVPALLRQLWAASGSPENYRDEPWFSLWSALCHQNDVYSASYAAVPHIVEIAATRPPHDRREFALFTASIEADRHRETAAPLPSELEADYFASIEKMRALTAECVREKLSGEEAQVFLGALAVFNGLPEMGAALLNWQTEN